MVRRQFTKEFKFEAVKLVTERIGFVGEVADAETVERYQGHRVPDRYRGRVRRTRSIT